MNIGVYFLFVDNFYLNFFQNDGQLLIIFHEILTAFFYMNICEDNQIFMFDLEILFKI